jgi:hypothetical protein
MLFLLIKNKSRHLIVDHYCHFHPISQAKWRCSKCTRFYDNACVPNANEKQQQGLCPFCESPLIYLPTENISSTTHFYPLKELFRDCFTSTHLYLLCSSLGLAILSDLVDIAAIIKITLCFSVVFFISLHFAREQSYHHHTTQQTGRRKAKYKSKLNKPLFSMLSPATSAQLTSLSLVLLLFPAYCFYSLNWFIGLVLIFIGGITFPFLIIFSLHSSDNDQEASFAKLFKELKPFYFKLAGQSLCLYWLVLFISDVVKSFLPLTITLSISVAVSSLSLFIMLNYCAKIFIMSLAKLSAQHQKLQTPKGPVSIYNHDKISSLDTDIDQALKTGQYQKVVALLEEALKRNGNSNLRRQQLFLLLNELQDKEKLARYALLFLYWMLERNKIKDASKFIYQLRKNDPGFLIHDLSLMSKLAKQFFRTKKYALVLWLAEDAKIHFKPCEDLASLYLVATQALITHYKDLEKAEEYLLYILQSCAEFPSVEAAKALLIHLQHNQQKQQDLRT